MDTGVFLSDHKTAIIIGGGSSIKSLDFSLIEDHFPIIGVNDAFKLGKFVDYVWFGDERWFKGNGKEWGEGNRNLLKGYIERRMVYTCAMSLVNDPDVFCYKRGLHVGIDTRSGYVAWNRSSGASAINFAYHLGARKILLIGFDMKRGTEGETHWHNNYPTQDPDIDTLFLRYTDVFQYIKKDADRLGIEIYNLNPDSAINDFPKITCKDVMLC